GSGRFPLMLPVDVNAPTAAVHAEGGGWGGVGGRWIKRVVDTEQATSYFFDRKCSL
ncbi:unnamed protein product, partial [Boreogadus saida]